MNRNAAGRPEVREQGVDEEFVKFGKEMLEESSRLTSRFGGKTQRIITTIIQKAVTKIKKLIANAIRFPNFRLLMYFLAKTDLPASHYWAYVIMGVVFGFTGPWIEVIKFTVIGPASIYYALRFGLDAAILTGTAVYLWLGSFLRLGVITPVSILFQF